MHISFTHRFIPIALAAIGFGAFCGRAGAQQFVGGGDPPAFDTTPTVSVVADSGTRDPISNLITGAGMLSKVTDSAGGTTPGTSMTLFRNFPVGGPYVIPPNPTGLSGSSNWVEFDLGSVVPLSNMWIWNWNEKSASAGNNTKFGWQFAAIQTSIDGTTWSAPSNVTIPQSDGAEGSAVDLVAPLNASARFIVLANQGVGPTLTYGGDDTVNDAGLSEVRFEIVPEPASLGLLVFGGLGLLRRRK